MNASVPLGCQPACLLSFRVCAERLVGKYCSRCWGCHTERTQLAWLPIALKGPFDSVVKSYGH